MRLKKQKRHRRAVKFFVAVFGFRDPFKVLCDGTFIHHLIQNDIVPADKAISKILGGHVKLFTTRCVINELKRIGSSHSEASDVAQRLICAKCDHTKIKSADSCILDVVGEKNDGHFFIATQDANLRKTLREVPGVPLIYALRNALLLEPPSEQQHEFAKNSESQRLHISSTEQHMLKKRVKSMDEDEEGEEHEEIEEQEEAITNPDNYRLAKSIKKRKDSNSLRAKGPQFKRKKAKGPNPLSVKKKKKPDTGHESTKENGKKRKRKRKSGQVKIAAEIE